MPETVETHYKRLLYTTVDDCLEVLAAALSQPTQHNTQRVPALYHIHLLDGISINVNHIVRYQIMMSNVLLRSGEDGKYIEEWFGGY